MKRSLFTQPSANPRSDTPNSNPTPDHTLDILIIGGGFAGCYSLFRLRNSGFSCKILEAGSKLGGVWAFNSYPGARTDSPSTVYAFNIRQIYQKWKWKELYPGHAELKDYFHFVGTELDLYRDVEFGQSVTHVTYDENERNWDARTEQGMYVKAKYVVACTGFAAKRYFPDWKGLDGFRGVMYHSSFWPEEGVDVEGKKVGVVGTGATGVQIVQEWAREVGEGGSVRVFQRTPQLGFPMQQRQLTDEYHDEATSGLSDVMKTSRRTGGGFDFDSERVLKTFDHSAEEREAYYRKLWDKGGFRFHGMNYSDFLTDHAANDEAYQFWTKNVRARIKDPRKRDLLAPLEKPHAIGGKRPSMEQWYYDIFDKPNVDIVDVRQNPIQDIVPEGIRTSDGVIHELDVIALATGFDSVTGGLKAMQIQGTKGLLRDKWEDGILTHLGISISSFPNFFMVYGPQAPTAFVNGPSAVEPQVDWIVAVLEEMRASGRDRIEATSEAEQEWRKVVWAFSERSLRHHIPSGWNGGNIPGKRQEPLSLASGLAYYCDKLDEVRTQGMVGFDIS